MEINEEKLKLLLKYLPEGLIDNIFNCDILVETACEYFKTTKEIIESKTRKREISYARMIIVSLIVKIFSPKDFEDILFHNKKIKIKSGVLKMASIAINKDKSAPIYFFKQFVNYYSINQIDIEYINNLELKILKQFNYID